MTQIEQEAQFITNTPHDIALGGYPNLSNPDLTLHTAKSDIISAITENQAVVIIAPPGVGKSTQLPKIALEAGFDHIVQTQPRRRPAINVGSRILFELGVVLGEEKANELVSWQTGGGRVGSHDAPIEVVTENTLLRKQAFHPKRETNGIWMLDEIHEQSKYQALLMGETQKLRRSNPDFTAVYMSATPDKHGLIQYLTDEHGQEPAVIELSATMYDIEDRERPTSDFVTEILRAAKDIHQNPDAYNGANTILAFESGVKEINDVIDELHTRLPADVLANTTILPNHSKLSNRQQELVNVDVPGVKIIVQTNIGKTSNTVPRTRYVITQGLEKQIILDEEGFGCLVEVPISQSCMGQQRGRAGRNGPGIFVHTKRKGAGFIKLSEREPQMKPEIQRTSLDETELYLAFRGEDIRTFDFKDAPDSHNMKLALQRMETLGAIDSRGHITTIGQKMYMFAASPEGQRSMVESLQHPQHIRLYVAAMVAMSESGGLKQYAPEVHHEGAEDANAEHSSDMLACLEAFIATQNKSLTNLNDENVSIDMHLKVEESFKKLASSAGVAEVAELKPPTEAERAILRHCILVGLANSLYAPTGDGMFKPIGRLGELRQISNQSVVSMHTHGPVAGVPRTLQIYEKGKAVQLPIIERITRASWQEIGKIAVGSTEWVHASLRLRGDRFIATEEQHIGSQVVDVREVAAEPGPRLRAAVIQHVKDNPGKSLLYLYKIKTDLESLAHKSKNSISRLTQDAIDAIIDGATPDDVTSPNHVEENLRQYIIEKKLSLDSYVSAAQRTNIIRSAPPKVEIGDIVLKVSYRSGKPLVYVRNNIDIYGLLPDDVQLDDGRSLLFVYDNLKLKSGQLKNQLRTDGLL